MPQDDARKDPSAVPQDDGKTRHSEAEPKNPSLMLLGFCLEVAARAEYGNGACWNLDRFAGLWITARTGFALGNSKSSEADELHAVWFLDVLFNRSNERTQPGFAGAFGHLGLVGHRFDKFSAIHSRLPLSVGS